MWRVRATLPDRPGTLATLARACGDAGVNILGLQVLAGVGEVTDELVLSAPPQWTRVDIERLLADTGARLVVALPCGESALADQPTRYVQAASSVIAQPALFTEVVAGLVDGEPDPGADLDGHDVMEMVVGDVVVHVRRQAPFTAAEHARGAAFAELVSTVLERGRAGTPPGPGRRLGGGAAPTYAVRGDVVLALVEGTEVGRAGLGEVLEPGERRLDLTVDPAWRRRGIGSRLLVEVARLGGELGESELVLHTRADNQAVLPMVLGSGLRGRIRLTGDELTVRVPLRDLQGASPTTR